MSLPPRPRRAAPAAALAACLAALAGCTMGPNYEPPRPQVTQASWTEGHPAEPAASQPVDEPVDPHWWRLFGDDKLTDLETRIAGSNFDVRIAEQRLAESRASLGVARADLLPSGDANASYTGQQLSKSGVLSLIGGGSHTATSQTSGAGNGGLPNTPASGTPGTGSNGQSGTNGGVPNNQIFNPYSLWQYGADVAWEVDFWGRVRRHVESAGAGVAAAQEAERATLLTAEAELARDYIRLRGAQRQLDITRHNLASAEESLKLTRDRAAGGLTTDLDVANAAAQVANTASQIPTQQAQEQLLINAIALLLALPPDSLQAELAVPHPIPPVPPRVPVGLPSELARRRPDIRQAEAQLHGATADIGVAVADFYPRLTLSASAAIQAIQFSELGNWGQANTWSIGPFLSVPIFEGGRLSRTLELRKAQQQEAAIAYQRTVLAALHEVDDGLVSYAAEQQRRTQLEQAVAQNRHALSLARDRYAQGVSDFLAVLDAERNLFAAEQALTDSITTVSTNLVQLYKALGGGWEGALPDKPPAPDDFTLKDLLP